MTKPVNIIAIGAIQSAVDVMIFSINAVLGTDSKPRNVPIKSEIKIGFVNALKENLFFSLGTNQAMPIE